MKIWIYIDGAQKGPFSEHELLEMNIVPSTPVWFEGMPKWLPAAEVPEMQPILNREPLSSAAEAAEETEKEKAADETADEALEEAVEERIEEKVEEAPSEEPAEAVVEEIIVEAPVSRYAPGQRRVKPASLPDEPCPPSYIGWSIFLTICCCSPISIGSLVASIFVTSYYNSGKLEKSKRASEWAAWLIMTAIALGFLPVMIMSAFSGN